MKLLLFVLLYCHSTNSKIEDLKTCDAKDHHSSAPQTIYLRPIEAEEESVPKGFSRMFFIESSGRDHVLPRQACAIESALINGNISQIIVGKNLQYGFYLVFSAY